MKTLLISMSKRPNPICYVAFAGILLASPLMTKATLPTTAPSNLSVVLGSATYPNIGTGTTGSLTISASGTATVLAWGNFSDGSTNGGLLAAGDTINFSGGSSVLNEISGGLMTTLNGSITSTGKIYFLNPAGIIIGANASINAGGFYASTIPETLAYFNAFGTLQAFTATPPATTTTGTIQVNPGAQLATVGGSGTVGLAGSTVTVAGLATALTGNLYIETQAPAVAGTTVTLGNTATATTIGSSGVGGNLTILTNGGNVNLANAANVTITGGATITTTGGSFNGGVTDSSGMLFSAAAAGTTSSITAGSAAGTVTFNNNGGSGSADFASLTLTAGNSSLVDSTANTVTLGASTITGTLAVTSVAGSINTSGAVAATGAVGLTANTAGKTISFTSSGNVNFGAISASGAGSSVTITGTGNLSFTSVTSPTVTITTTGGTYLDSAGIAAATKATISATGNMSLGAENTPLLSVTSGGTIAQTAAITSAAATFNAPTITLTTGTNAITSAVLLGGSGSGATPVNLADTVPTLTIANGTNVTGGAAISNAGAIALGAAASDTLAFGSTLALNATAAGAITTVAGNVNVTGAVTAAATNSAITLGAASTTNSGFGQISGNSGSGAFAINSSKPVNLGTLTTTGGLTVVAGGNITNTGNLVVTASGGVTLTAGTTASAGSIQLGATGAANNDVIPGTITVNNASSFTLWDKPGATLTVATGTNPLPAATLAVTDGSNLIVDANTSTKPLAALSYALTGGNGNATVTDAGSLTLSNATNVGAGATTVTVNGNNSTLTFGSGVALAGTGAASFTTTGSGTVIADTAASPVTIAGAVTLSAGAGTPGSTILVNSNTSDSFGALTLSSTGSISLTEGATMNLAGVTLTGTSGSLTLTSVTGSINQTGAITIPTGYTTASFNAPGAAGNIALNLGAGNAINATVPISLSAGGGGLTTVLNTGAILLGNVQVPLGTFTINTLASGGSITQAGGTSLFEYGTATFTTKGGAITLSNAGNNFGGLVLDATDGGLALAGANVSVREGGTNHYTYVNTGTAGNFTAVDDTANIIQDSGGGTGFFVGGTASFSAVSGTITLNDSLNTFGGANGNGIVAITGPGAGNASITDSSALTIVGSGTNVGGNLTITTNGANGVIRDSGSAAAVKVTGTLAALAPTAGSGYVQFTGSNDTFGSIQLTAGSTATNVLDNAPLVLLAGTNVQGPASITSSGSITTVGAGTTTFAQSLTLVAGGKIVITIPISVHNGLTVDSLTGPTDLSLLSLLNNLNSIPVVNLGSTSSYFGPKP
jgi:filamentous hemagglutinin family protein